MGCLITMIFCLAAVPTQPGPPPIFWHQVFGVADARYGEELCAWVRTWCAGL